MTNKSKMSTSGKLVCGCSFLFIGMNLLLAAFSVIVCIGGVSLYFYGYDKLHNKEYEYETTGYVYSVTSNYTYFMYYDENGELQYDKSNIHTEAAGVDSYITVRFDSEKDFIYVPELMDAYGTMPPGMIIFLIAFCMPIMIFGIILIAISAKLLIGYYKENRSKKQLKGVENNG